MANTPLTTWIIVLFLLLMLVGVKGCGYGRYEKLIAEGYIKEYHSYYRTGEILLSSVGNNTNEFYYSGFIVYSEKPTIGSFVKVYRWNYGYIYVEIVK